MRGAFQLRGVASGEKPPGGDQNVDIRLAASGVVRAARLRVALPANMRREG